jgi:aryl-alcohol dehydrogenase-like predicted oxidoreductase
MERRDFLKSAAAATIGNTSASAQQSSKPSPTKRPEAPGMIYRELGTTGERVSAIGMGGYHLAKDQNSTQGEMVNLVHQAMDRGITFFDNSWDYNDGISEVRLGKALKGRREQAFVMTKIDGRDKKSYNKQLEESMGRLGVDHVDLVQFHEIIRMEDPDRIFSDDGAIHAAIEARDAGKIRYIGFTGHKDPAVHLRMFETAARHNFHFDTVQMPVNVMDAHFRSFAKQVIPVAQKAGTGVLAMKTFGDDFVLQSHTVQPIECLHYGLSQPVAVVITGIDKPKILDQAIEAARTWKPMSEAEQASLLARTRDVALTGKFEPFKTTQQFDSTATNPKWLGGTNS